MTASRTLDDREREVEQNRAILVDTVDALRASVLVEVEEVRRKVSFDYIGTEIRNRVRANPLRSFAIGAGLSLPLWRMGRRVPMPLFLIGAGVALARSTAKNALADAASDASDRFATVWNSAKDTGTRTGQKLGRQFATGLDAAQTTVRTATNDSIERAGAMADAGGEVASDLTSKGVALLQDGSDRLADARDYTGRKITQTQSRAVDLFNDNPLLVAGAGLAFGALLAAIMPTTDVEGQLLDKVAPDLKRKATDLVDKGYDTVRATAGDVYDGAVGRAKEHGLSPEGAQNAASDLGGRVEAIVDAAIGQHGTGHPDSGNTHS